MTISQRSLAVLALAAAVSAFATSAASAGPIANMWNSTFSPGYYAGYGPAYYPSVYTTSYSPVYAYGVSYSGYGYAGYSSSASCCGSPCCSPCCGSACGNCGSCGCSSCGCCSSCAGGNCVASLPSTTPEPDNPPRTFEDPDKYDGNAAPKPGIDEGDGGFSPRGTGDGGLGSDPDLGTEQETFKPKTEESAIPQKKTAPTPMPAVSNDPTVSPLGLDDEFVWTAAPERTRVKVHARFGSPALARTRIAPEDAFETLPVATKLAAQK